MARASIARGEAKNAGFRNLPPIDTPFLLGVALLPSPSGATPTLAEAIKAADAKYLDAKDIEPSEVGPKIEAGLGENETAATPKEISQGEVKAALTYLEKTDAEGGAFKVPVVTVFAGGAEVAKSSKGPGPS